MLTSLLAALIWTALLVQAWSRNPRRPGIMREPTRAVLWGLAILTWTAATLRAVGNPLGDYVIAAGGAGMTICLISVCLATLRSPGRSSAALVPMGLLAFSAFQLLATVSNGQASKLDPTLVAALIYLPCLTFMLWRSRLPVRALRRTVLRIGLSTVWGSLIFTALDREASMGDLPRRVVLSGLPYRIAGITPHPNMLALVAGLSLFLILSLRPKIWPLHILACLAIMVLAEARTLTIGLLAGLLAFWVSSGTGSRLPKLAAATLFALVFGWIGWPHLVDAIQETDLTGDVATLSSRTLAWSLVGEYWDAKPFLGWGAFTFNDASGSPLSQLFFYHAHNQFLEALIEAGALGFVAMAIVGLRLLFAIAKAYDPGFVAVAVMTLVFMMTEVPFTLHTFGFNFTVTTGALLLAILVPGPSRSEGTRGSKSAESTVPISNEGHSRHPRTLVRG